MLNNELSAPSQLQNNVEETRLLYVDDDIDLIKITSLHLAKEGFAVDGVGDGVSMDEMLKNQLYDLVLLDLMLPNEDGLSICRRLQLSHPELPVIMITSKTEDIDRIIGLEMGADDYLAKPFHPRELAARIRAVIRRTLMITSSGRRIPQAFLQDKPTPNRVFGPFTFNVNQRRLCFGDSNIPITSSDHALLKAFTDQPSVALSRERLMLLTRGRDHHAFDRSIDVQVSRLRKVLAKYVPDKNYIQTIWGEGYVFVPEPQ